MSNHLDLESLQDRLAFVDLLTMPDGGSPNFTRLLVKRLKFVSVKIYQEPNHGLPHVHIAYGNENHAASYKIEDCTRLAGNLKRKYEKDVQEWIRSNQETLLIIWNELQAGRKPTPYIKALSASESE